MEGVGQFPSSGLSGTWPNCDNAYKIYARVANTHWRLCSLVRTRCWIGCSSLGGCEVKPSQQNIPD
jgi:hypothetical protein